MKTLLLISFLICFTTKAFAQYDDPPAIVTLKNGEIITGRVGYPIYANEKKLKIKGDTKLSVDRSEIKEVTFNIKSITFIPIKGYKNAKTKKPKTASSQRKS